MHKGMGSKAQMEGMALNRRLDTFFIGKGGRISWRSRRFLDLVARSFSSLLLTNEQSL